jgi:putative Ca2+/H+ antiporter (TMEM165/GDT1 family)
VLRWCVERERERERELRGRQHAAALECVARPVLLLFSSILHSRHPRSVQCGDGWRAHGVGGVGTRAQAPLILSTFLLVFAAEWGDKSFLATIGAPTAPRPPADTMAGAHGVEIGLALWCLLMLAETHTWS